MALPPAGDGRNLNRRPRHANTGLRYTVNSAAMPDLTVNDLQALSLAILSLESIASKLGGAQGKRLNEARAIILEVLTTEPSTQDNPEPQDSGPSV